MPRRRCHEQTFLFLHETLEALNLFMVCFKSIIGPPRSWIEDEARCEWLRGDGPMGH